MKLFTGIAITILVIGFSFVYWGNYFDVRVDNLESKTIVETGTNTIEGYYIWRTPYIIDLRDIDTDSMNIDLHDSRSLRDSMWVCKDTTDRSGYTTKNWKKVRRTK